MRVQCGFKGKHRRFLLSEPQKRRSRRRHYFGIYALKGSQKNGNTAGGDTGAVTGQGGTIRRFNLNKKLQEKLNPPAADKPESSSGILFSEKATG
jgi:hypothetical protein